MTFPVCLQTGGRCPGSQGLQVWFEAGRSARLLRIRTVVVQGAVIQRRPDLCVLHRPRHAYQKPWSVDIQKCESSTIFYLTCIMELYLITVLKLFCKCKK